MAKLPSMHGYT